MFSSQPAELLLETTCRSLTALPSDERPRFAAGTSLVRQPNQLFLLNYDTDLNELVIEASIEMESAIKCFAPCQEDRLICAGEYRSSAIVYQLPPPSNDVDAEAVTQLKELQRLDAESSILQLKCRKPLEQPGDVMMLLDQVGNLALWDLAQNTVLHQRHIDTGIWSSSIAWDPHNESASAVATGSNVHLLDWRTRQDPVGTVASIRAHRHAITDIDYNPNKPFVLVTAGQDGLLKFWDLRQAQHPLMVARGGHSHWVSRVQYNPAHDQLVLSAGTDARANLWRMSTISSAPLLTVGDEASPDVCVEYHEHSESICGACWAVNDPWVYMTLGYDGRVVLSHVPSKEKYKILL